MNVSWYIAEYRLFCRALLQKRPMILRSLLIVATPYSHVANVTRLTLTWGVILWGEHVCHILPICDTSYTYVAYLTWSGAASASHMGRMWHVRGICDMTPSYETYVTWLLHMRYDSFVCDMTRRPIHSVCDMSVAYVTWLICTWHDSFIRDTSDFAYEHVTWLIHP